MFESLSEKLKKMKEERDDTADISFKPYEEREVAIDSDYEQVERTTPAPIVANSGDDAGNIELKCYGKVKFLAVYCYACLKLSNCVALEVSHISECHVVVKNKALETCVLDSAVKNYLTVESNFFGECKCGSRSNNKILEFCESSDVDEFINSC